MTRYLLMIEDMFDTMAIEPRVFDTYNDARDAANVDNRDRAAITDEVADDLVFASLGWGVYRAESTADGFVYRIALIKQGQRVICNRHEGTIFRVLDGQLEGMVEVILSTGHVCIDITELEVVS